jgi:hypothetical protein
VCQLLIQTVLNHYDTFEVVDELNNTERGSAGINSMELRR